MAVLKIWAFQPSAHSGVARIFAYAVCLWTQSKWSHVGFSLDNDYYEALPFQGVLKKNEIPKGAVLIATYKVTVSQYTKHWIDKQVGKPYDWFGILGFIIEDSDLERKQYGRWFCSEIDTAVMRKCKVSILEDQKACHIFPGKLVAAIEQK
jgi:uncharacterized protein YycO